VLDSGVNIVAENVHLSVHSVCGYVHKGKFQRWNAVHSVKKVCKTAAAGMRM